MDKEKLGAKREAFNMEIRRQHHQKMLQQRRVMIEVDIIQQCLEMHVKNVQQNQGEAREYALFELVNVLGETDLFGGMKSKPELIQNLCQLLFEMLVKVALNPNTLREAIISLAGLSNLTGDVHFTDHRSLKQLMMFVEEIKRVRVELTESELQEIQWMYSNVLLKDPPFTEGQLANILCMLGDTTLYKVESGNDKLRLNVVQSLETLLKRHPLTIGTHKQYIRDISSRLADLLTVEDREASLEILRFYRRVLSHDRQMLSHRQQEHLITKSMELLSSLTPQVKEQSYRLMVCIAEHPSHSRFIIAHYSERLVKLLLSDDKRSKELILELLNEIVEQQQGDEVVRSLLAKAGLFQVVAKILNCRCFDVMSKALDLLIRCAYYSNDQNSNIALIKRYSALGIPRQLESLMNNHPNRPGCDQYTLFHEKCEQLLEWIRKVDERIE